MLLLIDILIVLVVLFIIGAAAIYIIQKFGLPDPVKWVVGAILLIGLLIYAAHVIQGGPMIVGKMG